MRRAASRSAEQEQKTLPRNAGKGTVGRLPFVSGASDRSRDAGRSEKQKKRKDIHQKTAYRLAFFFFAML